jgi:hypothetical protein
MSQMRRATSTAGSGTTPGRDAARHRGGGAGGRWVHGRSGSGGNHESYKLPAELLDAYLQAWPPDPVYEQRRPALQLHKFLNNVRHFGPDRYVPRIEAVLDTYGW